MTIVSALHRRRLRRHIAALVLGAVAFMVTVGSAQAATVRALAPGTSPLSGIQDDRVIQGDPLTRIRMMANAGARIIRVDLRWDAVSTRQPADATNPDDPAYDWSTYDRVVSRRAGRGWRSSSPSGAPVMGGGHGLFAWRPVVQDSELRTARSGNLGRFARRPPAGTRRSACAVGGLEQAEHPDVPPAAVPVGNGLPVAVSPRSMPACSGPSTGDQECGRAVPGGWTRHRPAGNAGGLDPTRVVPMAFVRALNHSDLRPPMDACRITVPGPGATVPPPGRACRPLQSEA